MIVGFMWRRISGGSAECHVEARMTGDVVVGGGGG